MAISIGVGPQDAADSASTSSIAVTLNGVTAGRTLIALVRWFSASVTVSSVACTSESNLTSVAAAVDPGGSRRVAMYVLPEVTASGNKTITVTFSGATQHRGVAVIEVAGADTTTPVSSFGTGSNSTANPSVSVTSPDAAAALFGAVVYNGADPTEGSGFTAWPIDATIGGAHAEYKLAAGSGSQNVDFTAASNNWALVAAAIAAAPPGPLDYDYAGTGGAEAGGTAGFVPSVPFTFESDGSGGAEVGGSAGIFFTYPGANLFSIVDLPRVGLAATASIVGTGAEFSLPKVALDAVLGANYWRGSPVLPTISLAASMSGGVGLTFEATLRPVSLTATLLQDAILSASPQIPVVRLTGEFRPAALFSSTLALPVVGLTGMLRSDAAFVATFTLPSMRLSAEIQQALAETYRTWALNLRKNALTEYDNFDFNSYAVFNGQVLACSAAGVVVLGAQAVDGAAAISARARTGKTDYGSSVLKRTPRAYLGYKTDGDVLFRTITSEDAARTYRLSHNDVTGFQQRRVPVGKGPKSRYWQFEVENENGADFTVSDVLAYPQVLRRRVM